MADFMKLKLANTYHQTLKRLKGGYEKEDLQNEKQIEIDLRGMGRESYVYDKR